jgi:hypothetical protein
MLIAIQRIYRSGDLGVPLRIVCWRLGRQLALHNLAATFRASSTAFPARPAIPEINSPDG